MITRTYVVGLPVVIEVRDDGRVEYTVDTSEASDGMREQFYESEDITWSQEELLLDMAIVDAQNPGVNATVSRTIPAENLGEMRCPVLYSCPFRTRNLLEMSEHIASHA